MQSHLELDSLDNLSIATEDDDHRQNEAKQVDVEDICHVHPWILSGSSPFDSATGEYKKHVHNLKFD